MSELPPDSASGAQWLGPPTTGAFTSSWRTALQWALWIGAMAFGTVAFFAWRDGNTDLLGLAAGFSGAWALAEALAYLVWGARAVIVTPEALVVTRHIARPVRIAWSEVRAARVRARPMAHSWVVRGAHARVVISERGFSTADWSHLGHCIRTWKASGPLAALPGVGAGRQGAVFRAHQPAALFWGIPFFAACAAVGLASSWQAYGDGSWPEDLMLSVGLPVFGFGFVAAGLWGLTRAVKRVTFMPDAMVVERYIGRAQAVGYGEVTDGWGAWVRTRQGALSLGDRNVDAFWRLLHEHLADGQLSGEAMLREASQLSALGPMLIVVFGVPAAAGVAGRAFGLSGGNALALTLALMIVLAAAFALWAHRRARRWTGGEPPGASRDASGAENA